MTKTANFSVKVTKAFVHGGSIRVPGAILSLPEAAAKPLLEVGKVVLEKAEEKGTKSAAEKGTKPAADDKKE